jgi:nanoRNase/pAp phosphatase (c-di-AMP/oligoRNAs hydrolase)
MNVNKILEHEINKSKNRVQKLEFLIKQEMETQENLMQILNANKIKSQKNMQKMRASTIDALSNIQSPEEIQENIQKVAKKIKRKAAE